jgi:hypothetical protein
MPDDSSSDFVTIAEAETLFNRSEKSLKRDINKALRLGKGDILAHIRLRMLVDGTEVPGSKCTPETAPRAVDDGLNPAWLIRREWLQSSYGRKGEPPPQAKEEGRPPSTPKPESKAPATDASHVDDLRSTRQRLRSLPEEAAIRAIILENMVYEKDEMIGRLLEEIKYFKEDRQADREQQKEINKLIQAIAEKIQPGGPGRLTLQVGADAPPKQPASRPESERAATQVLEAQVVDSGKGTRKRRSTQNDNQVTKSKKKSTQPRSFAKDDDSNHKRRTKRKGSLQEKKTAAKKTSPRKKTPVKKSIRQRKPPTKKPAFWRRDLRDLFRR